ncbi:MAG: pyrroline-5-carboxylate reductase [Acidobacteriota bacterium]|nr:pyrroline-5-carboxylate reductase [Acidobacteriota bacterium]MDQ5838429.1 pyrroline-5-carboxylate reductase [Acidobacteriota bacterium]
MNTLPQSQAANPLRAAQISFVGVGVMAEAMIAGLLRRQLVSRTQIVGSHPRAARREEMQTQYGIRMFDDNREAATFPGAQAAQEPSASVVVLAVKPQRVGRVLGELKGALSESQLVLSIVAGARMEAIAAELGHPPVVRAMPNTPAQIGQGMTAWTATPEVGPAQLEQVRSLLGALGREMYVESENMIDMATALSATGPTYIFMMMEALVDAGVHMGFSRHVAEELVIQTMLGSVLFARETHKHPAELRNMVTSPGGTSAEAIYQMEKGSLRTVLSKAVYAAYQRAVALGRK